MDAYTPIYSADGQMLAGIMNGATQVTIAGMAAWRTWLVANYPSNPQTIDNSILLWLAANPWKPWGSMTLAQYQAQQIAQLKSDCDALALSHYPQTNQTAMVVMLMQAAQQGLTNRVAYLEQVWIWATAITNLYYQQAAAIQACTAQSQVQQINWSAALAALGAQDPLVTIQEAMSIGN